MPSSRRPATGSPTPRSSGGNKSSESKVPPEILHQLGRAVLSYSLKKMSEQKTQPSDHRSKSSHRKSSRSKTREPSATSKRGTSRDTPRSDSGDMHSLISQLAVGVFAFGIRHIIRRRREAKRQAAAAAAAASSAQATATSSTTTTTRDGTTGQRRQQQGTTTVADPELSAALETVTKELQGASDSIKRLASSAPSSHRNCAVRDALVADEKRLSGSLANMQASIHNMRNLHPGLEPGRGQVGTDRRRQERARARAMARERERAAGEEGRERTRAAAGGRAEQVRERDIMGPERTEEEGRVRRQKGERRSEKSRVRHRREEIADEGRSRGDQELRRGRPAEVVER
ncbi:hypothetical protein C8A00DRAFT_42791 [Chaetomidium leptoderma]|uniref:Uncharacterized protein n=1 Tax=Chaetomidium leptoderma TaxID=669021 RepID=A0AAN6ZY19_9PEZI|nr:hypothetical protein C8A00DRAFT_42791 [Chaetomidium leptoderma]